MVYDSKKNAIKAEGRNVVKALLFTTGIKKHIAYTRTHTHILHCFRSQILLYILTYILSIDITPLPRFDMVI
jgi:hypothetical protein